MGPTVIVGPGKASRTWSAVLATARDPARPRVTEAQRAGLMRLVAQDAGRGVVLSGNFAQSESANTGPASRGHDEMKDRDARRKIERPPRPGRILS